MPVNIPRLRYWFAAAAIAVLAVVAGFYIYALAHGRRFFQGGQNKLPTEVQQRTQGFSLSKSEGGHTLFTVHASRATQYKEGGRAELQDVNIVVYGRESDRFDQIYGTDFQYDPQSGNVIAKGTVHIDLQADSTGVPHPDQAPPQELKNPIHLKTSGLVFNQKSGDAVTGERIEFRLPQANGWANGANYDSRLNSLVLERDVHLTTGEPNPANIVARHGVITKAPRRAVLYDARIERQNSVITAGQITFFLRDDNSMERILGTGGVDSASTGPTALHVHGPQALLYLKGSTNDLQSAELSGGTSFATTGANTMSGSADTVTMAFGPRNRLDKVHAQGNVKMLEPPRPGSGSSAQTVELAADAMDFLLVNGKQLQRAETSNRAQITLTPQNAKPGEHTVVTAAKFYADFDKRNRLTGLKGMPDARVVSSSPGQADRVSTSRAIDVAFAPAGGVTSVVQQGDFHYGERLPDGADRQAWAQSATYLPETDTLTLTGNPRVVDGGTTITGRVIRLDRRSGDASAEANVKTTYNDLKPQPGGALLAAGDPVHVTAQHMVARRATGIAHYSGDARLWQNANIIEAPTIDFDRDKRSMSAVGARTRRVLTVLTHQDKAGKQTPVNIRSARLTYSDNQRLAHFEGGVVVTSSDGTVTANQVDVFLKPSSSGARGNSASMLPSGPSQLERMVAEGNVVLQQPNRRGTGQKLVYTAADDRYVMTGGPPTIVDTQHGTVTGASLTFYNRDDRVLVEGGNNTRATTQTRVSK